MKKKKQKRLNISNNIQIEYETDTKENHVLKMNITLRPTTDISVYGDNPDFIWEGSYNGKTISVKLARQTPVELADISNNLPNKIGSEERISLREQIFRELKRILSRLD